MKKNSKRLSKTLMVLFIILFFIIVIASTLFVSVYISAKLDKNALVSTKTRITMFDNEDNVILNDKIYKYIPYEDISPYIINSFIALEDKRFYQHNGVDYHRLAGALLQDIKTLSFKEGGSTITQQLAKNTHLCNKKTLKRKIQELHIAKLIEKEYTKEQIIEMYLNAIYFGHGIYGIDSACRNYFGKAPSDLTVSESALLAGIVKNPSKYSPKSSITAAKERRDLVLRLSLEQGYINEKIYQKSLLDPISIPENPFSKQVCTSYFEHALKEGASLLGISEKQLITSNYQIHTFYSAKEQNALFLSATSDDYTFINKYGNTPAIATILADNKSCGIIAYYSNIDISPFSLKRQPASTIKPILVYSPALEYGYISPQTPLLDKKIEINGYSPKNYGDKYLGWISAETALAKSVNTIALKLFNDVGKDKCFTFAQNCGINFSELDGNAAALGGLTDGTTPAQLLDAYMTLANNGYYTKSSFIKKITDGNGKIILENKNIKKKVISDETTFLISKMLEKTVEYGSASKLNGFPFAIAAKTGTSQNKESSNNLDAWNLSYTTQNTLCVWYGGKENSKEHEIQTTGGGYPTLLARKIYSQLPSPIIKEFQAPQSIFNLEIDEYALNKDHEIYLANKFTPRSYRKNAYFSTKNYPKTLSPYFDINNVNFTIKQTNLGRQISIAADENYSYILQEYNLLDGSIMEKKFNQSGVYLIEEYPRSGIYSYKLDVFFNENKIGTVYPSQISNNNSNFTFCNE